VSIHQIDPTCLGIQANSAARVIIDSGEYSPTLTLIEHSHHLVGGLHLGEIRAIVLSSASCVLRSTSATASLITTIR
jgi:hypothetical protein